MKKIAMLTLSITGMMALSGCSVTQAFKELEQDIAEFKYSQKESRTRLLRLGRMEGFHMSYEYTTDDEHGTVSIGNKGYFFWVMKENDEGYAIEKKDEDYLSFDFDKESATFVQNDEAMDEERYNNIIDAATQWLFYAHSLSYELVEDGKETIHGRECTKYKFKFSTTASLVGKTADIQLSVDDQLGITLKAKVTGGDEETSSVDFLVSEFTTGASVTLPNISYK